jgi:hydroxymethylbilane synthase
MPDKITIGTRKSVLALWQTDHVADLLRAAHPDIEIQIAPFSTRGDEVLDKALPAIDGKGVFTEALEQALRDGAIDYAVHSLKDLPTDDARGLTVGAITKRGHAGDALISKHGLTLDELPHGAVIGTSSRRRAAQLLAKRPDLHMMDIRGNVGTRIDKALAPDSPYDAILLACAGLDRLELCHHITQILPLEHMLPAPGQGALAVQCRDDADSRALLAPINHDDTALCVTAERAFLSALGGGCSLPVAAYGEVHDGVLNLRGRVCGVSGQTVINVDGKAATGIESASVLGMQLAQAATGQGADRLIAEMNP